MAVAWCSPSPKTKNPLHSGEGQENEEDEEDENVQQLEQCARLYKCLESVEGQVTSTELRMQDCLVNTDRNWRACQTEVKALKECHEAKAKKQDPDTAIG